MIVVSLLTLAGCASSQQSSAKQETQPAHEQQTHEEHALHNLHQLTPELWSAGEPVGEDAYAELASLGIKTVISVDGVAPNKELAAQHGISIVHLPIGYDGISEDRSVELAHAIATMPRPIFVNCHHGKHRGPAALCVGAIGSGDISNEQASAYMTLAKTSPKYKGLWEAAEVAQPLSGAVLYDDSIELPEEAQIEDFIEAMAEVDRHYEHLQDCADNNFNAPEDHPDLAPISLAGQIHNLLRGMEDDKETAEGGPEFYDMLIVSRDRASELETRLEHNDIKGAYESLKLLTDSCSDCHTKYRNNS
ncbi:MAG TPA: hypothetical protein DF699_00600 [Phycisphaerales bacterium]|nr:hypothetical protein [Phycisphaerae bacterium]HCT43693.1 hypothetical protein [Phycisphaerales bacterium]